jgi:formylmethanofuran dehydrogenase subunit A
VTRAGPARLLGLAGKGHLGVGADADVTVYARDGDIARMFASPRYVIKAGRLVVEEGQLRRAPRGRRLHVRPGFDQSVVRDLRKHFETFGTVAYDNYAVRDVPGEPVAIGS